ncbi:GxxExxY protein [Halomonas faecis]|uniref:GxxExxY protein n=1 Tax=Halomonas faecis TaxID=1562110 RepID=UPI0013D29188|nr:GxxExxY protein [Halomonas faecis]
MHEEELTYKIRGAVFEVYRQLGHGFLESVYQKALIHELSMSGIKAVAELPLSVVYKDHAVGEFRADIVVENKILLELKATSTVHPSAEAQVINYLKATGLKVGLLINFAWPKATVKRLVF